jgi:hypothetical protein
MIVRDQLAIRHREPTRMLPARFLLAAALRGCAPFPAPDLTGNSPVLEARSAR